MLVTIAAGIVCRKMPVRQNVIRKILGLPKRYLFEAMLIYLWIHLVLADQSAYGGCRLNLVSHST